MMTEKQNLIDALKRYHDCAFTPGVYEHSIVGQAALMLENSEEVVHGRWMPCGFGKEIMCSVCGCELDDGWEYRYCPDCGANMEAIK